MPADRLLGTLLRSLQTYTDQQDTPRLLGSASSLLTTLTNPLNVTLLTSQLLSAPAIWAHSEGLRTSVRCLSVFHAAAQAVVRHESILKGDSAKEDFSQLQLERTLAEDVWIRAVINGADDHSPRWRHLMVLGGFLLGFGPPEDDNLSRSMRSTIESALTAALNLALKDMGDDELAQETATLVLNHCFPAMSDHERARLNYDLLLPVLMRSTLHSSEGLRSAYFLGVIDHDVYQVSKSQFQWPERCSSYQQLQSMLSSPLLSALGPLSRMIAHCFENVKQARLVTAALDDLEGFARRLHSQWRQNKLSEIDASEENLYLDRETRDRTTPTLWKLLRSTLYAVVVIWRSAIGRLLGDRVLAGDEAAPIIAAQALHTLRHLYFITARSGSATFSQYTFVNLTAMDILAAYPKQAELFMRSVKPTDLGQIPQHPLDRCLDLFFLNTAEHFSLVLSTQCAEELLISAASPYLAAGGNNNLLPLFEAAHSVMLAAFSAPQNTKLTLRQLPFYVEALFKVFPSNLSARQFRLAFKTLIRLTAPPSILSGRDPMLPATLLELIHERIKHAPTVPLFPSPTTSALDAPPEAVMELSEQAILTLAILDTLSQLPSHLLEEWLPLAADMVNSIEDGSMREHCKKHFWHVLVDGEMDPSRSSVCHGWWSTVGGRKMMLNGRDTVGERQLEMSGALPSGDNASKL